MKKVFLRSVSEAFHSIRTRFFHTFLSVLGIVIGVAALVATLSLIDGLELYAKEQIRQGTNVNRLMILSEPTKTENNLRVRKKNFAFYNSRAFNALQDTLTIENTAFIISQKVREVNISITDSTETARVVARNKQLNKEEEEVIAGTFFSSADTNQVVVNEAFSHLVDSTNVEKILGNSITIDSVEYQVEGILKGEENGSPEVYVPIDKLSDEELAANPPMVILLANDVEDVVPLKEALQRFHENYFGDQSDDLTIATYEGYAEKASQGFLIFRIVMGLIVGLSVLVGGVGIMNVLLISVNERTREIGVRKALGADRKTIVAQFLGESIAISIFGSIVGVIVGILFSNLAIFILQQWKDVPFGVGYTWQTMLTIAITAVAIGVLFGTYPAVKASRLNPVDAIRRT